jgi:AcrR family transcriptional regulator
MEREMDELPLRERNKRKVTQRIIAAAVELFKTQGYHQATMDDIASKAEVSRGTLFNYFPSKESLLIPWAQEILDGHISPKVMAFLDTQPATLECLRLLFTLISETILAAPDVVQAFMTESLRPSNVFQGLSVGNGVQEIFVQIARYGQAKGDVRTDLGAEHIAYYSSALLGPLLFSLLEPKQHAIVPDLETLLAFMASGLNGDMES